MRGFSPAILLHWSDLALHKGNTNENTKHLLFRYAGLVSARPLRSRCPRTGIEGPRGTFPVVREIRRGTSGRDGRGRFGGEGQAARRRARPGDRGLEERYVRTGL